MRVREENCNMLLLAAVTLASLVVASGLALLEPATAKQEARQYAAYPPADRADTTPVRVVGAPFVPNTNPRERQ